MNSYESFIWDAYKIDCNKSKYFLNTANLENLKVLVLYTKSNMTSKYGINLFVIIHHYKWEDCENQSKWTKGRRLTKIIGTYKSEMPGNSAGNYVTLHEIHSLLICNGVK